MIRLDIYTNLGWETLSLLNDVSLRIELNSPLFEIDIIPGDCVYNFDIPVNEVNSKILKAPHILSKNGKVKIYDCRYFFANKLVFKGKFLLIRTTAKSYTSQITVKSFAVDFKDVSIKSIEMDKIELGDDADEVVTTCNDYVTKTYPAVNVNFPSIYNNDAYGDYNADFGFVINRYDTSGSTFYKNDISALAVNFDALSAQPYLAYVFKKIFEEISYKLSGDLLTDAMFQKLLIYSNYLLDNIVSDQYVSIATGGEAVTLVSDWIKGTWSGFYIDLDTVVSDDDSCISLANNTYEIKTAGYHEISISFDSKFIADHILSLQMKIILVVDLVIEDYYDGYFVTEEYLSFSDNFTWYAEAADIGKKIKILIEYLNTERQEDVNLYIDNIILQVSPVDLNRLNIYKHDFYINDTLPDITISTFLNAIKDIFKIAVFFSYSKNEIELNLVQNILSNNNYVEIDDYVNDDYEITINEAEGFTFNHTFENDELTAEPESPLDGYNIIGSYASVADLPTPTKDGDAVYLKNYNEYRVYSAGSWVKHSDNIYDYIVEGGENEYKPSVGILTVQNYSAPGGFIPIPSCKQLATSEAFGTGINEPGFKLMIWWGLQPYPYANCTNYDDAGNKLADYNLRWDDSSYGLFENYHSNWTNFIIGSEEIRIIAMLPIDKYLEIISLFEPNSINTRKIRFREVNYLPKKISALHRNNSNLIETEIIMIKKSIN